MQQSAELFSESLRLAFTNQGSGRAFLLLHGGAGPASVAGLAGALAQDAQVIVSTHPGFNGEARPAWFRRIDDLVLAYLALIETLDLADVVVVGNSVGGWIAAELALRMSPRVAGMVLLNAVGIDAGAGDRPIGDPMTMPPAERASASFHDPQRFAIVPAGPDAAAAMAANQATLRVYAGEPFMHDPTLRERLANIAIPSLLLWGESDRIVDVAYGRRYAASIPGARFEPVPAAGHFPQIEQQDVVAQAIRAFAAGL